MHVLAVGVSDYGAHSGFTKLKVCTQDARRVAQTLRDLRELNADPSHIRFFGAHKEAADHPTGGHTYSALEALAETASSGGRLLFFFSGHGVRVKDEFYLVPEDGNGNFRHAARLASYGNHRDGGAHSRWNGFWIAHRTVLKAIDALKAAGVNGSTRIPWGGN